MHLVQLPGQQGLGVGLALSGCRRLVGLDLWLLSLQRVVQDILQAVVIIETVESGVVSALEAVPLRISAGFLLQFLCGQDHGAHWAQRLFGGQVIVTVYFSLDLIQLRLLRNQVIYHISRLL